MGRRKERRIAAVASSRRVKLDLFAEPSEDLGSSSKQDEVGGADDAKSRAGLPSSPSSSGKQPENPLVLLGQYSDDEVDDGSSGDQNRAIPENSLVLSDDTQEKVAVGQGTEGCINDERNDDSVETAEQIETEDGPSLLDATEKLEAGNSGGILASGADVLDESFLPRKTPASTSDAQVGDVISGWKIVWHEESNQYYYWNIATGETSWKVPDVLVPVGGNDVASNGEQEKANVVSNATYPNFNMTELSDHKVMTETLAGDVLGDQSVDPDADKNHLEICSSSTMMQSFVTSPGKSNDIHRDEYAKNVDPAKLENGESCETGNLPFCVSKHCELLLEKLNSIKRSEDHLHGHVQMCKYTFEAEMRLADMKSLACHGSSLLPFWQLSEKRLQQLEESVNHYLQELKAEKVNEVASSCLFPENNGGEVDANSSGKKEVSTSDDSFAPDPAGRAALQNNLETFSHQTGDENVPSEKNFPGFSGHVSGATDEDMDVDMEVEDVAPSGNLCIAVTSEQSMLPTLTSADLGNPGPEEVHSVPPPPDEDWIPPPPPDDEPFPPPPPPDEPPEVSYSQPSDLISMTSFPYVGQYNIYPGSEFQYVAQTTANVATGNLYGQTEGLQPAVSQPPLYFETLPDTYGATTLAVNPIETGLYYSLQDATPQSLVQTHISDSLVSLDALGNLGSASLPKGEVEVSVTGANYLEATLKPSSSQTSFQSSATTTMIENVSVSSIPTSTAAVPTSAAAVSTSTTASKVHSKVPRSKKRTASTVSSRSNKKVFNLVDKWKAAKEELQEQEEPENALEILERKRQREIEEWRKQQIASGEAKDNANFQPLGGDWRERVKRKRAQREKESVQKPSDVVLKANSPPDLDELSKGLPHGWQAFWDDSTKQVYYGNTSKSETSWIRPTD